jgi:hypothetical protein
MWRRVDLVWTDASEERIASIFRVEKSASEKPREQVAADTFLRNVGSHKIYTAPHPRRRHSSMLTLIPTHNQASKLVSSLQDFRLIFCTSVAARSKAWIVFARSNAGIVGSNTTEGMGAFVC